MPKIEEIYRKVVRIQKRPRRSKPILSLTNFRYVWTLKSWSAPWRRDRKLMKYLYPRQRGSNRILIDEPNLEIFRICIFSSFVLSFINWHKPLIISKYSLMLSYLSLNSWNSHITVRLGTFAFDQPPETARSHRIYFLPNVSKYAYIISLKFNHFRFRWELMLKPRMWNWRINLHMSDL